MARYTIDVGEKFDAILRKLAESGETTKSEMIRKSVTLYYYIHNELKNKDYKLSITDKNDKVIKDIIIP